MSGLTDRQIEVAKTLFGLPEAEGFALAGGAALVTLGLVDRTTRDLDAFVGARHAEPPGDVSPLADAFEAELSSRGWAVVVVRQHQTFARLLAEADGEHIEVDLAVDAPCLFPLDVVDGLPVFSARDLAARKVLAVLDRAEARDFTDLWSLAQVLGRESCITWAEQLDRGLEPPAVARAFRTLERLDDRELPVPQDQVPTVREWFERWGNELGGPAR